MYERGYWKATVRLSAMAGCWTALDDAAAADAGVAMMLRYIYIYVKMTKGDRLHARVYL